MWAMTSIENIEEPIIYLDLDNLSNISGLLVFFLITQSTGIYTSALPALKYKPPNKCCLSVMSLATTYK